MSGDHVRALGVLGHDGLLREIQNGRTVDDLFFLADLARLANEPRKALLPLQRIVEAHGHEPSAALAAFTSGKVRMQLGDPEGAVRDFDTALTLGLPEALANEAKRRRTEAGLKLNLEVAR